MRVPAEIRDDLERALVLDLVGPVGGPDEELERGRERPTERYVLGMLAPLEDGPAAAVSDADDEEPATADIPLAEEALAIDGMGTQDGEDGASEAASHRQMVPSSFGFTCTVETECDDLVVEASWGRYLRVDSGQRVDEHDRPLRVWARSPAGGTPLRVPLDADGAVGPFTVDPEQPEVVVRGLVRTRGRHRHVSLFLVNGQPVPASRPDEAWLLQAELIVSGIDGHAVFCRRSLDEREAVPVADAEELAGLDMQYRDHVELAVGHGVGVAVETAPGDPARATRIRTTATPRAEVPPTTTPNAEDFADLEAIAVPLGRVEVDMRTLAQTATTDLAALLEPLVDAYEAWIDHQRERLADPGSGLAPHREAAERHLRAAVRAAERIRRGIAVLGEDEDAAESFRFANHVMWQQRVQSIAAGERRRMGTRSLTLAAAVAEADVARNRSWRAFQLAFVLLNIPALAEPGHPERSEDDGSADLLFFPTGGGKTEAYLGLTAFALAARRLGTVGDFDGRHGVAVLMRYTLRLLTLQQFQRAAALMCACEIRRRELYAGGDSRWGGSRFRIGLWVGETSTPTRTDQARDWLRAAKDKKPTSVGTPLQLSSCPWCGESIGENHLSVDPARGRTIITCGDGYGACPFTLRGSPGEGLPVVVVDEEIYRLLPALVIATVDKFARMPWVGASASLFGRIAKRCERHGFLTPDDLTEDGNHPEGSHAARGGLPAASVADHSRLRPPDLIVQDELHLITGPLGSMVGLYETAVDELATWELDGQRVRPKVIASTATIRRAGHQVGQLFARDVSVFPPPGLDARDNFFAVQRDRARDESAYPGRRYIGVCAPGRRFKGVLVRVYLAQLRAAWALAKQHPGPTTDGYLTLVGYFNSLRELGGMKRLVDDDVQSALWRVTDRGSLEVEELTSRQAADRIPVVLDKLALEHQVPRRSGKDRVWAVDVALATNMLSVGVDVPRLGAMVVAGQPKATSEYIQATSRVGRAADRPGLVLTVYNWSRPRDLSHYETFEHYHRTFYRQVEALSVTPFAARALTRGLTGVVASMARLGEPDWNANRAAADIGSGAPAAQAIVDLLAGRAERTARDNHVTDATRQLAEAQVDRWQEQAMVPHRTLTYRARSGKDGQVSLLKEPGPERWNSWTVPTSLRNVEAPLGLRLEDRTLAGGDAVYPPIDASGGGGEAA